MLDGGVLLEEGLNTGLPLFPHSLFIHIGIEHFNYLFNEIIA
jgi:hypothetical protein